jgi:hypothetical protein
VDVRNLLGENQMTVTRTQILGNQIKDLSIIAGQILITNDSGTNDLQSEIDLIKENISNVVGPMNFKGVLDASSLGAQLDDAKLGDTYYVSVAGTILTTIELQVGDMVIVNKTVTGTPVAADIDKIDNTEAPDILRQGQVDDSTLEYASNTLHIKALGVTASEIANDAVDKDKINADVAGSGLGQNADGSLEVKVDDSTVEIYNDALRVKASGITANEIANDAVGKAELNVDVAGNGIKQETDGALSVDFAKEVFVATQGQTVFTLAATPVSGSEDVFLNGLLQVGGVDLDYTISGAVITFAGTPALHVGEVVVVKYLK